MFKKINKKALIVLLSLSLLSNSISTYTQNDLLFNIKENKNTILVAVGVTIFGLCALSKHLSKITVGACVCSNKDQLFTCCEWFPIGSDQDRKYSCSSCSEIRYFSDKQVSKGVAY